MVKTSLLHSEDSGFDSSRAHMLIIQTTCASKKEAEKIGRTLVSERLAACATIHPCVSIFFWKGKLQKEKEWALELKAAGAKYAQAERRIKQMHSYKLPQIMAFSTARASREYSRWVKNAILQSPK